MKFLNTTNKLNFEEYNEYVEKRFVLKDEYLDYTLFEFIEAICKQLDEVIFEDNVPTVITFDCEGVADEDVEYCRFQVHEAIAESIKLDKANSDWMPPINITNEIDSNYKTINMLLNYNTTPNILNVKFEKNGEILYNLIKE